MRYFLTILLSSIAYSQAIQIDRVTSDPPVGACNIRANMRWNTNNSTYWGCNGTAWAQVNPASTGVPSGSILILISGSCPATYTEVASMDGLTLLGTLAANMDVGTTGGSDNITPAGTNSAPVFTGTASQSTSSDSAGTPSGSVSAPVFTGSSANTSTDSGGTPSGTNSAPAYTGTASQSTSSDSAGTPTVNSLTAAAQVISGSTAAEASHTHSITGAGTVAWPAGVPTFSGNAFSSVINHTHTINITDPGHTHLTQRYPTATGASSGFTIDTSMSGTLADNTLPTKINTTGITASSVNPAGGVASITPTGTIAWPAGVPTFTGSGVTSGAGSSHLHAVGTLANSTSAVTGTLNALGNHSHTYTSAGTVAAPVFTGSALTGHFHTLTATGTISAPTFTGSALGNHSHTYTAAGTNSAPIFTGDSFDNRSTFVKVIFCSKD